MTLDQWLFGTLTPHVEIVRSNLVDWGLTLCDERRSAIPRAGPDLCVDATVPLAANTTVKILVDVAEGQSALDGRTGWRLHDPSIRDIYVERLGDNGAAVDSLDVPALSQLETQIRLPGRTVANGRLEEHGHVDARALDSRRHRAFLDLG